MPISTLILSFDALPPQTDEEQPVWMSDRHVYLLLNLTEYKTTNGRTIGLKPIDVKVGTSRIRKGKESRV